MTNVPTRCSTFITCAPLLTSILAGCVSEYTGPSELDIREEALVSFCKDMAEERTKDNATDVDFIHYVVFYGLTPQKHPSWEPFVSEGPITLEVTDAKITYSIFIGHNAVNQGNVAGVNEVVKVKSEDVYSNLYLIAWVEDHTRWEELYSRSTISINGSEARRKTKGHQCVGLSR